MNPLELLLEPFRFEFMRQAFAIAVVVAVPTALLSCFLVLKGWALMGDAISHAVFPGVVLAYVFKLPLAFGAFVAGLFSSLATGYISENSRVKQDTVLGIVFAGMFGLGLVLYVKVESSVHLTHILFGDMLGVSWADVARAGLIGVVTAGAVIVKRRDLLLHAFDAAYSRAVGLRVGWLHYGLLGLIALAIVGALDAVGVILAVAMLIAPGAVAHLVTRRFDRMLLAAVTLAVAASLVGVYLSYFLDSAPAPTVVLLLALSFVIAFVRSARRASRTSTTLRPPGTL